MPTPKNRVNAAATPRRAASPNRSTPPMPPAAASLDAYFERLPPERGPLMRALRAAIDKALPKGFVETISYGMPGWVVPLATYPAGYHCTPGTPLPFVSIASQKSHIAFYHMGLYADPALLEWFKAEWGRRSTKRLDMGKSCVRFRKPEDVPVDLLADLCRRVTPRQWIETYEAAIAPPRPKAGRSRTR